MNENLKQQLTSKQFKSLKQVFTYEEYGKQFLLIFLHDYPFQYKIVKFRYQQLLNQYFFEITKKYPNQLNSSQYDSSDTSQVGKTFLFKFTLVSLCYQQQLSYYQQYCSSIVLMKRTTQQWISFAKQRKRYFFFYEEKVLDLTQFIFEHPGGKKALTNYFNKDITDILFNVFPHKKDKTLQTLFKYVIGTIPEHQANKRLKSPIKNDVNQPKEKKRVCFKKKTGTPDDFTANQQVQVNKNSQKKSLLASKKSSNQSATNNSSPKTNTKKQNRSQDKRFDVSIKTIEQNPNEEKKIQMKNMAESTKKSKQNQFSSLIFNEELDQQKPIFKVPILKVRHMNEL